MSEDLGKETRDSMSSGINGVGLLLNSQKIAKQNKKSQQSLGSRKIGNCPAIDQSQMPK